MPKLKTSWFSQRLGQDVTVTRWGEHGTPVLFFPTAAADAEEVERFLMVRALAPLLDAGRIKLYSVDTVAGQALLSGKSAHEIGRVQIQTQQALPVEPYVDNRVGGALIVVDPTTNRTSGALLVKAA